MRAAEFSGMISSTNFRNAIVFFFPTLESSPSFILTSYINSGKVAHLCVLPNIQGMERVREISYKLLLSIAIQNATLKAFNVLELFKGNQQVGGWWLNSLTCLPQPSTHPRSPHTRTQYPQYSTHVLMLHFISRCLY